MLYKVTPMMPTEVAKEKKPREPGAPRKKRKSAIYDGDGNEVLITLMCLKCKKMKPLMQFGLRKMADGAIRNQPWCRTCRSGAGLPKPKITDATVEQAAAEPSLSVPGEAAVEPTALIEASPAIEAVVAPELETISAHDREPEAAPSLSAENAAPAGPQ